MLQVPPPDPPAPAAVRVVLAVHWLVPEVMAKLEKGEIDPEAMITHRFPFADFLHAFEVADNADEAAKVVLTFD